MNFRIHSAQLFFKGVYRCSAVLFLLQVVEMFATVIPPVETFGRRDAFAFGLHFSDGGVLLR
jgi:hypothetical protein